VYDRRPPQGAPAAPLPVRLAEARARATGAIQAIVTCGEAGVIPAEVVWGLSQVHRARIEPILRSADLLWRTAELVRELVRAGEMLSAAKDRSRRRDRLP
jgi:hypothetical protein